MNKFKKEILSFFLLLSFVIAPAISATKKVATTPPKTVSKKTVAAEKNNKKTLKNQKKTSKATTKATTKTVAQNNQSKTLKSKQKTSQKPVALSRNSATTNGRVRVSHQKQRTAKTQPIAFIPYKYSFGDQAGLNKTTDSLSLKSNAAIVIDPISSKILFEKNSHVALPMASITKLMTALVVVESMQDMNEILEITEKDIDREKGTSSRLRIGTKMSRTDMLHLALMSSENRAASALGRHYPGGLSAFVAAMNIKAQVLGMADTHFVDSSGLSRRNVASAIDLTKLVMAASQYPILRKYSTDTDYAVDDGGRLIQFGNTNRLVHSPNWEINLQKTGYISEAGQCLVMQSIIDGRPIVMVLLDSKGKGTRLEDAARVRNWLMSSSNLPHA